MHVDIASLVVALSNINPAFFGLVGEAANVDVDGATGVLDEVLESNVHGSSSASNATLINLDGIVTSNIALQCLSNIDLAVVSSSNQSAGVNVSHAVVVVESKQVGQHLFLF